MHLWICEAAWGPGTGGPYRVFYFVKYITLNASICPGFSSEENLLVFALFILLTLSLYIQMLL